MTRKAADRPPRPARGFRDGVRAALEGRPPSALAGWEVDIGPMAVFVDTDRGGRPAMCIVAVDDVVLGVDVRTRAPADLESAARWMLETIEQAEATVGFKPLRLRVRHPDTARALSDVDERDVDVTPLPTVDRAVVELRNKVGALGVVNYPWISGSWAAWGFPGDLTARLFAAAAAFWTARPWAQVGDGDTILMTRHGRDWFASVMGGAGMSFGISLYSSAADLVRTMLAQEESLDQVQETSLTLSFESKADVPRELAKEVRHNGWPVAGDDAYPMLMATNIPCGVLTANHAEALIDAMLHVPAAVAKWHAEADEEFGLEMGSDPYTPKGHRGRVILRRLPSHELVLYAAAAGLDSDEFGLDGFYDLPLGDHGQDEEFERPTNFVTDIRHFLGSDGQIPANAPDEARGLAEYLGSIVRAYTRLELEDVECRRLQCTGTLDMVRLASTDTVHWVCDGCGETGLIANWRGTQWDESGKVASGSHRVRDVTYCCGMLDPDFADELDQAPADWGEVSPLDLDYPRSVSLQAKQIDSDLRAELTQGNLTALDGIHGDTSPGEPVEYECLNIWYREASVQIVVRNRGIAIASADPDSDIARLHPLLSRVRDLAG